MVQAPSSLDALFEQARNLEPGDRALLAHWLIDSIVEDSVEKEPGYDEYWEAELERRVEAVRNGTARLIPLEEAWEKIFASPLD